MPDGTNNDQKLILVVGNNPASKAIEAVVRFVFEQRGPIVQRVLPRSYAKVRAGVEPHLVIVANGDLIDEVVQPTSPEFFIVCYKTDEQRMKAETHNGVATIPQPVGNFDELNESIQELLFKSE